MADFSITISVPDASVQELVDAINWHDPQVIDGVVTPRTAAQGRAWFKAKSVDALQGILARYRRHQRDQQALAAAPNIT